MRAILTILLSASPLLWGAQEAVAALASPQEQIDNESLIDIAARFDGKETLQKLQALLKNGRNPNIEDSSGNTPLLYLCEALEMDYRYRTDPHFAQAADAAIKDLLLHGADALHENKQGCNAVFYLQSKPQLLESLKEEKLIPKNLSVRIPYEPSALRRYMRLRVNQASCSTHPECLQYLSQRYCSPAYERAFKLLQQYLKAESGSKLPSEALNETLSFLRLADAQRIEEFINESTLWEHGEHFLEEVPGLLLETLNQLEWKVQASRLRLALKKLDSMLPRSSEEMIDCHAALPMGRILEMLYRQEGEKSMPDILNYTNSRDPELAYKALKIILLQKGLPEPAPEALAQAFGLKEESAPDVLPPLQQRLYECSMVDRSLRVNDFSCVDANMLRRVQEAWTDMGLTPQARLLDRLLRENETLDDAYELDAAHSAYNELPSPSPRMVLARYILEHPETFLQQATTKQETDP